MTLMVSLQQPYTLITKQKALTSQWQSLKSNFHKSNGQWRIATEALAQDFFGKSI